MAHALNGVIGADLDATSTTQVYDLGLIVTASDNAEYVYALADEALAQYAAVKVDDDFECSELTTTLSGAEPTMVAIPQVAFADAEYGWMVISGACSVLSAGSCAADVKVYTTATAGVIDDAATDLVQGLKLTANETSGSQATVTAFGASRLTTNCQD